jgi:hypothetical protein
MCICFSVSLCISLSLFFSSSLLFIIYFHPSRELRERMKYNIQCRVPSAPACSLVSCWTYFVDPEDGGDMFLRNVRWHSTRRYITEDGTLHNHRCENLTSYNIQCNFETIITELAGWSTSNTLEMIGSNLGRVTSYSDFCLLLFSLVPPGKCGDIFLFGHYRFFQNPFQFIIHESACHLTLCTVDAESVLEKPHIQNNYNSQHRSYGLLLNVECDMDVWKQQVG